MELSLEIIGPIASIITAIIAVVGIIPLFYSIRQTNRSIRQTEHLLRFNVYYEVIEMLEKQRDVRQFLYNNVPEKPSLESVMKLKESDITKLDNLARTFDNLGLLVKHGAVPLDFVLDFYSAPIVMTWHRLEPYVTFQRTKKEQKGHMKKFEILAIYCKKHRDKEHPEEETFQLSVEQEKLWPEWLDTIWFLYSKTRDSLLEKERLREALTS